MVVPVELAAVNVRSTLKVRFLQERDQQRVHWARFGIGKGGKHTCEHRDHAKEHLLDALNGTPTLRGLFVPQGILAGVV